MRERDGRRRRARRHGSGIMTTPGDTELVSDGTLPCPVQSPGGLPCVKHIPRGWTASEGHGGGHFWMAPEVRAALDRGDHYDATAAISGQPFSFHRAEDCAPGCLQYRDQRGKIPL